VVGAVRDPAHEPLLLFVGASALPVLLVGLALRWSAALALGVGVLGTQQAVRLALGANALDAWTPAIAGALLLVAELAWWSIEQRVRSWAQPGLATRRLAIVALACIGGSVVSGLVVVAAGAPLEGGLALELLGVAAAAAALALLALVARSWPSAREHEQQQRSLAE
jgi:hypothetical protein